MKKMRRWPPGALAWLGDSWLYVSFIRAAEMGIWDFGFRVVMRGPPFHMQTAPRNGPSNSLLADSAVGTNCTKRKGERSFFVGRA